MFRPSRSLVVQRLLCQGDADEEEGEAEEGCGDQDGVDRAPGGQRVSAGQGQAGQSDILE